MTDNTFLKKLSRTFFAGLVACLFIGTATTAAHAACATNEIDVLGDGTQCETSKFEVTTTNLSANDTIKFTMSAKGTFYVDCGTDGTLTQISGAYNSTTSGMTVTIGNATGHTYTCTYSSGGTKTIRFSGIATAYTSASLGFGLGPTISFYSESNGTQDKIAAIDGSLGAMFPVLDNKIPHFIRSFQDCTSLTSIPAGLFSGIDTSSMIYSLAGMFISTFYGCTSLTSIPAGLFSDIDTSSTNSTKEMFNATFGSCTSLTSIPAGLFSAIDTSSATDTRAMFYYTFSDCTSLTGYIPPTTFPNTITPGSSSSSDMWYRTFYNTQLATSCPAGTAEYNTGFQNDWGSSNGNTTTYDTYRVSCEPCVNSLPTGASWVSGTCNFTCETGWHINGGPDLNTTIGTVAGGSSNSNKYGFITNDGNNTYKNTTYGLTENGTFALEYANNKGMIKGRAQCSSQGVSNPWYNDANYTFSEGNIVSTLPNSTGQNCYCTLDEYTPVDGAPMSLSGPWVFGYSYSSASSCARGCVTGCADYLGYTGSDSLAFRTAIFGSLPSGAATCVITDITIGPGYYLPAGTETPVQCTAGNFCPGLPNPVHYDANNDQGITSCSTVGDGSYTNSAAGANENTACYKSCTVATANIAHATAVTGNDYYGAGTDTCSATSCENGYHINGGTPDLNTIIGTVSGGYENNDKYGYISNDGNDTYKNTTYGLTENGTFALEYANDKGMIKGRAQCSSQVPANPWYNDANKTFSEGNIVSTLPDSTGQYCYCTVDEYTPVDGAPMSLSGPWVFDTDIGSDCVTHCAFECPATALGNTTSYPLAFRAAIFGSLTGGAATCEITDITVEPGYYLPAGTETPVQCTAGNFCPGGITVYYNANNNQGITACSTLGDHSYTNSNAGASANSDCYKLCTSENVPHATVITGKDYYGDGADTCSATSCENGYHTYTISAAVPLTSEISNTGGWYWALGNDGYDDYGSGELAAHGVTQNGTFTVWYWGNNDDPDGDSEPTGARITGRSQCSTRADAGYDNTWIENTETGYWDYQILAVNITDTLPDNSGTNCYCTMDGYAPAGGAKQSVSNPWVSPGWGYDDASDCATWCADACGYMFQDGEYYNMPFREIFMINGNTAACTGNTITVNWSNASAADIDANEAGTVTYGGDIRTPRAATIIPGKVFLGWKFSRPGA